MATIFGSQYDTVAGTQYASDPGSFMAPSGVTLELVAGGYAFTASTDGFDTVVSFDQGHEDATLGRDTVIASSSQIDAGTVVRMLDGTGSLVQGPVDHDVVLGMYINHQSVV